MHVIRAATTLSGKSIHFESRPFTGVLYDIDSADCITAESIVVDGAVRSEHDKWGLVPRIAEIEGAKRHPLLAEGMEYSGVLYIFRPEGTLANAIHYREGKACSGIYEWHANGAISGYYDYDRDRCESWHENGALATVSRRGLDIWYSRSGKMQFLELSETYDTACWARLSACADNALTLSGQGVTDSVLAHIYNIEGVTDLTLQDSMVSEAGLSFFGKSRLHSLTTRGNRLLGQQCIEGFLARHPECEWSAWDEFDDP